MSRFLAAFGGKKDGLGIRRRLEIPTIQGTVATLIWQTRSFLQQKNQSSESWRLVATLEDTPTHTPTVAPKVWVQSVLAFRSPGSSVATASLALALSMQPYWRPTHGGSWEWTARVEGERRWLKNQVRTLGHQKKG